MAGEDNETLSGEFKRQVTGNKNSKLKRVIYALIVVIIILIGTNIFTFYQTEILSELNKKPSIEVIMPQTYNEQGFFEIELLNGEKPLRNVKARVSSCYMDKGRYFEVGDLPAGESYMLPFYDEETINKSKKIDCHRNPFDNLKEGRARFKLYINKTSGEFIMPTQNNSLYSCGTCLWNITIYSNLLNQSFERKMHLPIGFMMEGISIYEGDLNSSDIQYHSEVILSLYDWESLEKMGELEK